MNQMPTSPTTPSIPQIPDPSGNSGRQGILGVIFTILVVGGGAGAYFIYDSLVGGSSSSSSSGGGTVFDQIGYSIKNPAATSNLPPLSSVKVDPKLVKQPLVTDDAVDEKAVVATVSVTDQTAPDQMGAPSAEISLGVLTLGVSPDAIEVKLNSNEIFTLPRGTQQWVAGVTDPFSPLVLEGESPFGTSASNIVNLFRDGAFSREAVELLRPFPFFSSEPDAIAFAEATGDASKPLLLTVIGTNNANVIQISLPDLVFPRWTRKGEGAPLYLAQKRASLSPSLPVSELVFVDLQRFIGGQYTSDPQKLSQIHEVELKTATLSPADLKILGVTNINTGVTSEESLATLKKFIRLAFYSKHLGRDQGVSGSFESLHPSIQAAILQNDEIRPASMSTEWVFERARKFANAGEFERAASSFSLLADQGDARSQALLARMYLRGDGVARDPIKARELLEPAAASGSERALYLLGKMYFLGDGVAQDKSKGMDLIKRGAAAGSKDAQEFLAEN